MSSLFYTFLNELLERLRLQTDHQTERNDFMFTLKV